MPQIHYFIDFECGWLSLAELERSYYGVEYFCQVEHVKMLKPKMNEETVQVTIFTIFFLLNTSVHLVKECASVYVKVIFIV